MAEGVGMIHVVGITDAGPAGLTAEAQALVGDAALLCGGERHLAFFPEHPAERFTIRANLSELVEHLRDAPTGTVVLASGDPTLYGVGPYLSERLGRDRVCIHPNVSAVQLAFARLGESWQDAAVLSVHGRPLENIFPAALVARKVAILTDDRNTPAAIARFLIDAGDADARLDVFEHLDGELERRTSGTLDEIAAASFAALNLLIVRRSGPPRPWPLGLPDDAYVHARGLITKAEVRVVSLAKLRLHEQAIVWDVGAGSGAVAIEAAALVRHGRVHAVERDPVQCGYLAENRRRFAAGNLCVVEGEAPAALEELPEPDAVFVGGSGGHLAEIIRVACQRLTRDGRSGGEPRDARASRRAASPERGARLADGGHPGEHCPKRHHGGPHPPGCPESCLRRHPGPGIVTDQLGTFSGVGVGPGDPELMTLKAMRIIRAADLVCVPVARHGAASLARSIASETLDPARQQILELVFAMRDDGATRSARWDEHAR